MRNSTDIGVKMLWVADKLANIRSLSGIYSESGEKMWENLHQSDPEAQRWYYRSVVELTELSLNKTGAFKELIKHINFIWPGTFDSETVSARIARAPGQADDYAGSMADSTWKILPSSPVYRIRTLVNSSLIPVLVWRRSKPRASNRAITDAASLVIIAGLKAVMFMVISYLKPFFRNCSAVPVKGGTETIHFIPGIRYTSGRAS